MRFATVWWWWLFLPEEALLWVSKNTMVRHVSYCFFSRKTVALTCSCFFVCLFVLDCLGVFKGKHKLWDHLRTHTQERVVACPTCGGMFSNNTKFFDHVKRQVSEDSKWICFYFLYVLKRFSFKVFYNKCTHVVS